MKYKIEHQFSYLTVLGVLGIIYISNLILIKLPFISISFLQKTSSLDSGLLIFLLSYLPKFNFEMQAYNIQTIVVWAQGVIWGSKLGFITLSIYILLGLFGLPIFASGGGLDYYREPTFGYLISFPLLAFLSGWLYEQNKKFVAIFLPIFTTHLLGITYLLLFQQHHLNLTWHLSFSMISYDLIFTILLTPIIPFISFFLKEMFIQEVPVLSKTTSKQHSGNSI